MKMIKAMYSKKITFVLFLLFVAALIGAAPSVSMAEPAWQEYPGYTAIKGGYYYPTERIRLDEFSGTDFERRNGFNGEIAFGRHYGPVFGTEFGIGYFENERFPGVGPGRTQLEALPVLLSAKLFLPIGPIEPYGEFGVGAYFTKFEVENPVGGNRVFREVDYGTHAGVGVNINFTDTFYVGLEGRYRWVEPEYDGRELKLDGYTATLNLGFRY